MNKRDAFIFLLTLTCALLIGTIPSADSISHDLRCTQLSDQSALIEYGDTHFSASLHCVSASSAVLEIFTSRLYGSAPSYLINISETDTLRGYTCRQGTVFVSMNAINIASCEIRRGNQSTIYELDSSSPFVLIVPKEDMKNGAVLFKDVLGEYIPFDEILL